MAHLKFLEEELKTVSGVDAQAITTNTNHAAIDRMGYNHLVAILDVGTATGTTPTIDVKLQHNSTSGSSGWADFSPNAITPSNDSTVTTAKFPQVTTGTGVTKLGVQLENAKRYIRFVSTVGGSSPSYTMSITGFLTQTDGPQTPIST